MQLTCTMASPLRPQPTGQRSRRKDATWHCRGLAQCELLVVTPLKSLNTIITYHGLVHTTPTLLTTAFSRAHLPYAQTNFTWRNNLNKKTNMQIQYKLLSQDYLATNQLRTPPWLPLLFHSQRLPTIAPCQTQAEPGRGSDPFAE